MKEINIGDKVAFKEGDYITKTFFTVIFKSRETVTVLVDPVKNAEDKRRIDGWATTYKSRTIRAWHVSKKSIFEIKKSGSKRTLKVE
jgi:hypothetical protein